MNTRISFTSRALPFFVVFLTMSFFVQGAYAQEVTGPTIATITPFGNIIGSIVTLTGKNFDSTSIVSFDGIYGSLVAPISVSSDSLTFQIPITYPGAHSVQVTKKGDTTILSNLYSVDVTSSTLTPVSVFSLTAHIQNPESKTGETKIVFSLVDPKDSDSYMLSIACPQGITARMKEDAVCGNTIVWKNLRVFPVTFNNTSGEYKYISVSISGFDKSGTVFGKDNEVVGIAPFIGSLSEPTSVGVLQVPVSTLTADQKTDLIVKIKAAIEYLTAELHTMGY